jgi:hypothetical protein
MDLSLSSDQTAILDSLDSLCRPYESPPLHDCGLVLTSPALHVALREGGFLDVGLDPDLGAVTAALVVERLARLPFATEIGASALVRPLLSDQASGPLCLMDTARPHAPMRFLANGATVLLIGDSEARQFIATTEQIRPQPESLFAYPMATLLHVPEGALLPVPADAFRIRWRVALAAECAGLLAGALASVTAHVSDRQQFGRPLATFQALRHRLAEAQVRMNGVRWLALKAAATLNAGDAALAALHAQESARATVYDFHQFMGAMGMTLEHPLHLWTYRLKALIGELGGRAGSALAAADALWP